MLTYPPLQVRELLVSQGEHQLTLSQAVALILGSGGRSTPLPRLTRQVTEALQGGACSVGELQALPGIGLAKAASLVAALSLERLVRAPSLSQVVTGPQVIYEACGDILTHPQEHLLVFFLNVRTGILRRELVSVGTATASLVHPREVFRAAITYNAHSIILAHNHPSGDPAPSAADYAVTKRVAKAGSELGIELLDHIICASGAYVSLKEHRPSLFL